MFAEEPVAVAFAVSNVADAMSTPKEPTVPFAEMFSPSAKTVVTPSVPVRIYFTKSVIGSSTVAATA